MTIQFLNMLKGLFMGGVVLVNFDNNVTIQLPDKLIDYVIAGRLILNVTKDDDFIWLAKFLEGECSKRIILEKPENYVIRHIARKFVNL